MQTLLANIIFAVVVGIPNALILVMLLNAWPLRHPEQQLPAKTQRKHAKSLLDGAKIARNCLILVVGAAAFYFGLSLSQGLLDPIAIQLCLEGLLGTLLPLVAWRWFASLARRYKLEAA
ncbi:MAG: hypothetical protein ACRDHZ_12625 [Ktedonobacteraceae bacterium]